LFFSDLPSLLRDAMNSCSPSEHIAQAFSRENSPEQVIQILATLRNFIVAGDQRLTRRHVVVSKNHP
jgi:hypothetical protein